MKRNNARRRQWHAWLRRYFWSRRGTPTPASRLLVPRGWLRFDGYKHRVRDREFLQRRGLP